MTGWRRQRALDQRLVIPDEVAQPPRIGEHQDEPHRPRLPRSQQVAFGQVATELLLKIAHVPFDLVGQDFDRRRQHDIDRAQIMRVVAHSSLDAGMPRGVCLSDELARQVQLPFVPDPGHCPMGRRVR